MLELSRTFKRIPLLGLLGAAAWALFGCSDEPKSNDAPVAAPQSIDVQVVLARAEQVSTPIRASGTVAAMQTSNVTALVEGPVDRVFVRVGDRVTRGQPLLRIRQADYQRRASEAEAALRVADAEVVQTERAFERVLQLKERGFAPAARLDEAEAARDVARARRDQSRAALATARQALSDTVLRAPYDGVVTQRMVDEGMFLNSRFSMGGQSSALQLQELRVVAAIVAVPEARVSELRKGQPARLFITGQAGALPSEVFIINDFIDDHRRFLAERFGLVAGVFGPVERQPGLLRLGLRPQRLATGEQRDIAFAGADAFGEQIDQHLRRVAADGAIEQPLGRLAEALGH